MVGGRDDLLGLGHSARIVGLRKTVHEISQVFRTRRNVPSDDDRPFAQFTGFYTEAFAGLRIDDPPEALGKPLIEGAMKPLHVLDTRHRCWRILAPINQALHVDVGHGFCLKIPFFRFG